MIVVVALCIDRQLQHRRGLTGNELRDFEDLSVGEFQSVVLNVRIVLVNLSEARHLMIHPRLAPELHAKKTELAPEPNIFVEGKFRSRQQADCQFRRTVMNDKLGTEFPHGNEAVHV
ncbi:hypothetical protein [Nitrobacter sp.]|uniref:hypothetical protein n=1 Tax=Nitrobacter sp. TaxID=29420 RepID=UPI0029CAABEE|nr:hypothetical protein [Nitrobacter sp.]